MPADVFPRQYMSHVSKCNKTSRSHCVLVLKSVLTLKSLKHMLCFVRLPFRLVVRAVKKIKFCFWCTFLFHWWVLQWQHFRILSCLLRWQHYRLRKLYLIKCITHCFTYCDVGIFLACCFLKPFRSALLLGNGFSASITLWEIAPLESKQSYTVTDRAKKEQSAVPEWLWRSQAYEQFNYCLIFFFCACFVAKLDVWFQEVYLHSLNSLDSFPGKLFTLCGMNFACDKPHLCSISSILWSHTLCVYSPRCCWRPKVRLSVFVPHCKLLHAYPS